MAEKENGPGKGSTLRRRAEQVLQGVEPESPEGMRQILHELCVHQIELAMQNEELLRIQAELDASLACYYEIFNFAPVGYCSTVKDRIVEVNLRAAELLGDTPERLVQALITQFIFPEDQDIFYLANRQLLETGGPMACDLRMVKQDGTVFWAHLVARVAPKPNPGPEQAPLIRLVLTDMASHRQAEAEQAEREAQVLREKERERVEVLASGVAHDFNNLFTTILGNAGLGSLMVGEDGKVAAYFEAIEDATLKAADLTYQLLAYAGKTRSQKTEVDANLVVKEVAAAFAEAHSEGGTLHCDLADRLPFVKADSTHLSQVINNLLKNAAESCVQGSKGQITIRTRAEGLIEAALKADGWVLPIAPGRYATIEISDCGSGMSPELAARVFEPFFTTKFIGRGLGLAAVTGILRSHEGGITVRSEPGRGSTFKVFLPAMTEPRTPSVVETAPPWKGKGQMLVVDDEAPEVAKARHMAEQLGISVLEAHGGEEGLEAFRRHHDDLGLVLVDPKLPPLDRPEAYEHWQAIDPRVPVVLTTRYDAPPTGGLPKGLAGVLTKPYRVAEVQGLLARTLG